MNALLPEMAERPALAPRRVAVLVNASAGSASGAAQLRQTLAEAFRAHAIAADLQFLTGQQLAAGTAQAVRAAQGGEFDAVIVGGGDGTIRTVAAALAGSAVPLGVLPLGTFNHFAKDLRIPLAIDDAVALIAAGATRAVDVGEVNGRVFINNSSIGIYPFLVLDRERERRRAGLPKWLAMIIAGLRAVRHVRMHRLVISAAGEQRPYRSPCVFIGNNDYCVSGLALGSRERLDRGRLCLFVARQQSAAGLAWMALRCVLGLLDDERDLRSLTAPAVDIASRRGVLHVALDGEVEILRPPLHYRIRPGALQVFAPGDAPAL
jgi:diacylglycerol kinase family enzyme